MRKFTLTIASLALALGVALPAQAESDSDTATLSVTVETAINFTFVDATCDFPSVLPGTTTEELDCLQWNVITNNAAGWTLEVMAGARPAAFSVGGTSKFQVRRGDETGAYTDVPNGSTVAAVWETGTYGISANYNDDVRIVTGAALAAGNHSQTLQYTATTL